LSIFDAQLESPYVKDALDGLTQNTISNYNVTLRQFLSFVNSKKDTHQKITIDVLINEAKADITKTEEKIDLFFSWLMGKEITGYSQRGKGMRESSAHMRAYGYLRGFFANLDIPFERKWTRNIPKIKRHRQAIKKDSVYTFFDVDERTKSIHFNRELMQQFLANLKLRDITITLALLSSSQDSADLFALSINDITQQKGKSRIFWEGTRRKTAVPFRTFFSKEAQFMVQNQKNDCKRSLYTFIYLIVSSLIIVI
jgi:hypothetical protein